MVLTGIEKGVKKGVRFWTNIWGSRFWTPFLTPFSTFVNRRQKVDYFELEYHDFGIHLVGAGKSGQKRGPFLDPKKWPIARNRCFWSFFG